MNEKEIYNGKIFTLVSKDVEINGKLYPRDIIHHPGGVGILCIVDGKILLVSQFRHAVNQATLEIPAGKLEYHEDPYTCGMRELNEESGYTCSSLRLLTSIFSTPGFCDERIWIYEAIDPRMAKERLAQDEDEDLHSFWLPIEEAYRKVQSQEIQDAKTVVAILFAYIERRD